MMNTTIALEKRYAHRIAEEYRSKGYEVIEEPSPEQLPGFLSGYRPDLLVRKGNHAVIVEVKTRTSLAREPQVRDLSRLVQAQPGWNFELVVVGEGEILSTPEGARPLEREDILQRVEMAERLLEAEFPEAALLIAWSTSEATLRLLIEEEGISQDRLILPHKILNEAVANGVISRQDYKFLMNAMEYRNALVHGFKVRDFDPNLVRDLIRTTKELLQ
jgi:hypothetical protein